MSKSPLQTVKQFQREVHKRVGKIFPQLVENEARKILDAGQPAAKKAVEPEVIEVTQADAKLLGMPTTGDVEKPCTKALMIYGSKVKAARALGIAETTFRDRLKREHVA